MKKKWPLVVAVAFGLIALFIMNLTGKRKANQETAGSRMKSIVCARADIPAGTEIRRELLTIQSVPEKYAGQAIPEDNLKLILGRKAAARITREHMLFFADIEGESRASFTKTIPNGEGAYTVSISRGIKPGLIQPGDHIDLMASFTLPKNAEDSAPTAASWRQGSDLVNVVLLQNVTVLAVGDAYGRNTRSDSGGGADLTLALTLQESQTLMFASQHGELGATLRPENSLEVKPRADLRRITYQEIEQIIGNLDDKRTIRTIEVQRGTRTTSYPITTTNKPGQNSLNIRDKR